MNEMNDIPESGTTGTPAFQSPARRKPPKTKRKGSAARIILRSLLVFFLVILMILTAAWTLLDAVFNGPSVTARDLLTRSLSFSSGTWWIPSLFLGEELAAEIIADKEELELPNDISGDITINVDGALNSDGDEWKDYPDGIYIETVNGPTYTAHVMIIRDPSTVYLGTSLMVNGASAFSPSIPGQRLNHVMEATGSVAGINAGAFYDDGTSGLQVGATPQGIVVSNGKIVWSDGIINGFVGFNEDNVLVVSKSITTAQVAEWKIRDGCCFGPVLIMDGQINQAAIDNDAGWNPRTAIGQRADGAVIMVCIDGRQISGIGGSYEDIINIMVEYEAVNACNLDGGSSTVMYYRDTYGLYGEPGALQMVNSYSALQEEPRVMPTFFLVKASDKE